MPDDSRHDLDEILTHRAWLAGLARSRLFDQAQVDDVVQDTWLVALGSRPKDPAATTTASPDVGTPTAGTGPSTRWTWAPGITRSSSS